MRRINRAIVLLGCVFTHDSCSQPPATPSPVIELSPVIEPPNQSPTAGSPPPPLALPSGPSLSGTVHESDGQPVSDGQITYSISSAVLQIGHFTGHAPLDSYGRFVIDGLNDGNWVRVSAAPRNRGTARLVQPCATNAVVKGQTTLNVELVPLGITSASQRSPVVSGVVTQTIDGAKRPVRTAVVYYSILRAPWDAFTETDGNGRYTLCGVPIGPGIVAAGYSCNESMKYVDVDIRSDSRVDVDLTNFQCPGY